MATLARRTSDRPHLLLTESAVHTMHLLRPARYAATALLLVSGWGWLELLHSISLPGPRVLDALPLYESSRHDDMSLLALVAVWAILATLACLPYRPRFGRVAALLLGAAVFAVAVLVEGAQIDLARQATIGLDLQAGVTNVVPWIAAGICTGIALFIWGRPARGLQEG